MANKSRKESFTAVKMTGKDIARGYIFSRSYAEEHYKTIQLAVRLCCGDSNRVVLYISKCNGFRIPMNITMLAVSTGLEKVFAELDEKGRTPKQYYLDFLKKRRKIDARF